MNAKQRRKARRKLTLRNRLVRDLPVMHESHNASPPIEGLGADVWMP